MSDDSVLYCKPHGRLRRACAVCQLKGTEEAERAKDGPSGAAFMRDDGPKHGAALEPAAAPAKGRR